MTPPNEPGSGVEQPPSAPWKRLVWLVLMAVLMCAWKGVFEAARPLGLHAAMALSYVWILVLVLGLAEVLQVSLPTLFGAFSLRDVGRGLLWGVALFLAGGVGYALSQNLFALEPALALQDLRPQTLDEWALASVATLVLPVGGEELAFRGLMLRILGRSLPKAAAVLLSAVVFSIYHLSTFQLLSTFIYGIGLAVLVLRTSSLWPALTAHFVINGIGFALLALEVRP